MNAIKTLALAALAIASVSASAQTAGNSTYAEVGYTSIGYTEPGASTTMGAVRLMIGKEFSQNVAVEGMLGFGASNGSGTFAGLPYDIKTNSMVGIYVKPKAMLTPELEVFGRLGYASSNVKAAVLGVSADGTNSGVSYGLGASYAVAKNVAVNLDYMSYYDKDGVSGKGATLGVSFKF